MVDLAIIMMINMIKIVYVALKSAVMRL